MLHAALLQLARQQLALLHAHGANQHGLTGFVARCDVVDHRLELGFFRLVDEVGFVLAHHLAVRGNRHHVEAVGVHQFRRLGLCGSRHARQLVVHAEVVLQRDGGKRLVFFLDLDAFLGFDGLVDSLAPSATLEDSAGELVDDLHLALLHDVVLVAVVQHRCAQRHLQLVHQVALHFVVQVLDTELLFHLFDSRFGGHHDALVFLHIEVDAAHQGANDGSELVVQRCRIGDATGDDQRGACLVDEDGVDFVDDGVVMSALHLVGDGAGHVVAQVVEAELVVGSVGDVGGIVDSFLGGRRAHSRHDESDAEAEPTVDLPHPHRVATREVVVHRDEVHSFAGERIEVHRQRRHQRLAFARAHFGNPTRMQGGTTHQLDVVVTLPNDTLGGLSHHGERLHHEVVEILTTRQTRLEFRGLTPQCIVAQGNDGGFQGIDLGYDGSQCLDLFALTGAQDPIKHCHEKRHSTRDNGGAFTYAITAQRTSRAPACSNASRACRSVEPVVNTSSTSSTVRPCTTRDRTT